MSENSRLTTRYVTRNCDLIIAEVSPTTSRAFTRKPNRKPILEFMMDPVPRMTHRHHHLITTIIVCPLGCLLLLFKHLLKCMTIYSINCNRINLFQSTKLVTGGSGEHDGHGNPSPKYWMVMVVVSFHPRSHQLLGLQKEILRVVQHLFLLSYKK